MDNTNLTAGGTDFFKPLAQYRQEMGIANNVPEILFLTSYPPRECGIATYSQDLITTLQIKFSTSFTVKICPVESDLERFDYPFKPAFILNADNEQSYLDLAVSINANPRLELLVIQHEFGFFNHHKSSLIRLLLTCNKPICLVFHTVLKEPDVALKAHVQLLAKGADTLIVMTKFSKEILIKYYGIQPSKIHVIPHGTHLTPPFDKKQLEEKYKLKNRKVLSTFGLLSAGKGIETTLKALPKIIREHNDVIFLILGKTHPTIVKNEGEKYRNHLEDLVKSLKLESHVRFVNEFIPLPDLLNYLQLTQIYLFTSKDPNQAVSGTFSYAISSGCPIISTPIPHALEVVDASIGKIFPFDDSETLANDVNGYLNQALVIKQLKLNCLHKMASTAWENSAILHALAFQKTCKKSFHLDYDLPSINLKHIYNLTTNFGMIQFSKINQADINSGYTLDDNARAMIAMCQHYELTKNESDLKYIAIYLNFIQFCLLDEGYFLNYVDERKIFTKQNYETNLADSNGRAIWALGYLISLGEILPKELRVQAALIYEKSLVNLPKIHSTRAIAFVLKGLYYKTTTSSCSNSQALIHLLADRLVQMYKHEKEENWLWFESYLTYANSILPEALLCSWLATGKLIYKEIAKESFDFLLGKTFNANEIKIVSNKGWMHKGKLSEDIDTHFNRVGGEQPIDIAYTILALEKFQEVFQEEGYQLKKHAAFSWFLGNNHLHQIIYNPSTGGCYDGLEESYVNLNQGAESTVSYLMARLCIEKSNLNAHLAAYEAAIQGVLIMDRSPLKISN
jgi:glycosyltransferase involved in cell wall biosynthesis